MSRRVGFHPAPGLEALPIDRKIWYRREDGSIMTTEWNDLEPSDAVRLAALLNGIIV